MWTSIQSSHLFFWETSYAHFRICGYVFFYMCWDEFKLARMYKPLFIWRYFKVYRVPFWITSNRHPMPLPRGQTTVYCKCLILPQAVLSRLIKNISLYTIKSHKTSLCFPIWWSKCDYGVNSHPWSCFNSAFTHLISFILDTTFRIQQ